MELNACLCPAPASACPQGHQGTRGQLALGGLCSTNAFLGAEDVAWDEMSQGKEDAGAPPLPGVQWPGREGISGHSCEVLPGHTVMGIVGQGFSGSPQQG